MQAISRSSFRKFAAKFQPVGDEFPATLGLDNGTIDVPDRPGYSYAIGNDDRPIEAWRENIPAVWRLPVIIGRKHGRLTILRIWDTLGDPPGLPPIREHGRTHKYMRPGDPIGTGYDWTPVENRQIMPLRVQVDNATLVVGILPGIVQLEGVWLYYAGNDAYDMATSVPVSGTRYSLMTVYNLANVATIAVTDGSAMDADLLTIRDVPRTPRGHRTLGIFRLYTGQTALEESIYNSDILDPRLLGDNISSGDTNNVAIKGANYTLTTADSVVVFTATATATLPAAPPVGTTYRIVCRAGVTTIDGDGADTVKGEATQSLAAGEDLIITYTETGVWE